MISSQQVSCNPEKQNNGTTGGPTMEIFLDRKVDHVYYKQAQQKPYRVVDNLWSLNGVDKDAHYQCRRVLEYPRDQIKKSEKEEGD